MHFFTSCFFRIENQKIESCSDSSTSVYLSYWHSFCVAFYRRYLAQTMKEEIAMACWHHHHCWYPDEYFEPYPRRRRFVRSAREDDLSEIEEERDVLERRLRRLEKELEDLRQKTSEKRD
jgi:hypothetical protein